MNLQAMIVLALKISIVLTVFAVGLNATFSDATFLFRRPGKLIRAFLSMNVVMPFLALVLVLSFNLHPAVKIALAALSVSPVPHSFPTMCSRPEEEKTIRSACWWLRVYCR